ncbi:hypothetical protein VTO42DRAFT_3974 [Malbranchea cinnamomea]
MARAHIGYLVGYDATNMFRVWVPHLKQVFRTQDVKIDNFICYDTKDPHILQELRQSVEELIYTIETLKSVLYDDAKYEPSRHDDFVMLYGSESPKIKSMTPVATGSVEKNQKKYTVDELPGQFLTPEMTPEPAFQTTVTDNTSPDPGYQLNTELDHLFTIHPSSLNEPLRSRPRHHATPLMWVFDYKFDDNGYLLKHKACLVIRRDLVPANGKWTCADTLAARTARVMFALLAYFNLDARHLDGVNAFLNSFLDEEKIIYCFFPDGFKQSDKVMRLLRTLYGLPRLPYLWFRELTETLKGLGFKSILEDVCLLINGRIIIFFYVDDIIILNRPKYCHEANKVVLKLKVKYEICDLGYLHQ